HLKIVQFHFKTERRTFQSISDLVAALAELDRFFLASAQPELLGNFAVPDRYADRRRWAFAFRRQADAPIFFFHVLFLQNLGYLKLEIHPSGRKRLPFWITCLLPILSGSKRVLNFGIGKLSQHHFILTLPEFRRNIEEAPGSCGLGAGSFTA